MLKRAVKRQKREQRGGRSVGKERSERSRNQTHAGSCIIEGDGILEGFSFAGDILSGVAKDPLGAISAIGDTFSKGDIWKAADKYFREDAGFQKALGITTGITDVLQKVLGAVPGVGNISKVIFKGWDALTGEFKAKPGAVLTNKMADWGRKADEWDRIKKKHPDIGLGLMGTVFYWFKKLGMTKTKAKMPEIIKDYHRRLMLFNKYLEKDIKERLKDLGGKAVIELAENKSGQSDAILKSIKENPSGVSPEFHIALFKYMRSSSPKSANLIEAKRILQPSGFNISSQVFKLDKKEGRL